MVNPNSPQSSNNSASAKFIRKYGLGNQYRVKTAAVGNVDGSDGDRPNPRDFYDVYPVNEINADVTQYQITFKNTNLENDPNSIGGYLLENNLRKMIEEKDWFYESRYLKKNAQQNQKTTQNPNANITTHPTSLIDDCFNHIDFVGIINNHHTDSTTLPIGFDVTCDTSRERLRTKFARRHAYGMDDNAPDNFASEFGSFDTNSSQALLQYRYQKGLKIPGFSTVKYFENKKNPENPLIEKGRIEMMPRLVIGYDPEIAKKLSDGIDTKKLQHASKIEQQHIMTKYNRAALKAKWCTLIECHEQVEDILYMLNNNLGNSITRYRPQGEIIAAKKQIQALKNYFDFALEQANKAAEQDAEERFARNYAMEEDEVQKAIKKFSKEVYVENTWNIPKTIQAIGHDVCKAYNKK